MTVSYLLGNLLGRAAISYVLVWLVCLLVARFKWRQAFRFSARWYSILIVVALTLLGIGGAIVRGGGLQ